MPFNAAIIESTSPAFPSALRKGTLLGSYSRIWAIGNLKILETRLLGFFCSTKCPGSVIVHTYDLARALRDAGLPVISGFHSPMERACLDLLIRGTQPVVICPARNIERIRLPATWRKPIAGGRMLVLSPFAAQHGRSTAGLAEQRNRLVATLANAMVITYASPGLKIDRLYAGIVVTRKPVYTLDLPENAHLRQHCVTGFAVPDLVDCLLSE
jgi:predicted Rossmann fold nucleotide-binding protein DprA/Smf involved in DNA uptake